MVPHAEHGLMHGGGPSPDPSLDPFDLRGGCIFVDAPLLTHILLFLSYQAASALLSAVRSLLTFRDSRYASRHLIPTLLLRIHNF